MHAAKNDLTAAKLLLQLSQSDGGIDVRRIEDLIMQAASKIDELVVAPPRSVGPELISDRLREILERQAHLLEAGADIMAAQADLFRRRRELAHRLVVEKRKEARATTGDADRQRVEREVVAFERELNLLNREIEVLDTHRQRALAQAATARRKALQRGP